jgi:hypothetical protein
LELKQKGKTMSKLIVEMEMPKSCPCNLIGIGYAMCCSAANTRKRIAEYDECVKNGTRPDWCPIKGVLPDEHGDLIDRDKFVDKYIRHYTEQERKMNLVFAAVEVKQQFADMICDERAVIAAERKDDDTE